MITGVCVVYYILALFEALEKRRNNVKVDNYQGYTIYAVILPTAVWQRNGERKTQNYCYAQTDTCVFR